MIKIKGVYEPTRADVLAIDTLFKCIAERGRKIRTRIETACPENSGMIAETNSGPFPVSQNSQGENLPPNRQVEKMEGIINE